MLIKMVGRQNILTMFGRKRNNRGMIWASILGLGVSAAAYGFSRNGNKKWKNPVQNSVQNFMNGTHAQNVTPHLTEFSEEFESYKKELLK